MWHGGDLDEARRLFPGAPEPWIDLSTGINPIAYPMPALPSCSFARLPSPAAHRSLEAAAAEAYGAAGRAEVVAAPGTQGSPETVRRTRMREPRTWRMTTTFDF